MVTGEELFSGIQACGRGLEAIMMYHPLVVSKAASKYARVNPTNLSIEYFQGFLSLRRQQAKLGSPEESTSVTMHIRYGVQGDLVLLVGKIDSEVNLGELINGFYAVCYKLDDSMKMGSETLFGGGPALILFDKEIKETTARNLFCPDNYVYFPAEGDSSQQALVILSGFSH